MLVHMRRWGLLSNDGVRPTERALHELPAPEPPSQAAVEVLSIVVQRTPDSRVPDQTDSGGGVIETPTCGLIEEPVVEWPLDQPALAVSRLPLAAFRALEHAERGPAPDAALFVEWTADPLRLRAIERLPGGSMAPLDIALVGPGLSVVHADASQLGNARPVRWSRAVGALGSAARRRLTNTGVALVGCGRTGSMLATSLVRLGVRRLGLIDPVLVELANLDAMDGVGPADVGQPKATALAAQLMRFGTGVRVDTERVRLPSLAAIRLAAAQHVVACCTDYDEGRWWAGDLATLYLRPFLDIGTAVQTTAAGLELGADIRLLLPGEACLRYAGSVVRPDHVGGGDRGHEARPEGAGSLRSLNQVAVGLAVRLLEDLATGRLRGSRWLRVAYNAVGDPSIEKMPLSEMSETCPQCALRGRGLTGLADFAALRPAAHG